MKIYVKKEKVLFDVGNTFAHQYSILALMGLYFNTKTQKWSQILQRGIFAFIGTLSDIVLYLAMFRSLKSFASFLPYLILALYLFETLIMFFVIQRFKRFCAENMFY